MKNIFVLAILLGPSLAMAGDYQRTRDGKTLIWVDDPKPGYVAAWSGRRDREGYATGKGRLTWFVPKRTIETGTTIPSVTRYTIVGVYSGRMDQGRFVGPNQTANLTPTPKPQARNQQQKRSTEPRAVESRAAKKSPSPATAKSTSASASPTAAPPASSPAPTAAANDESLNSIARPPSSLGLSSSPETSPHPTPEQSPSPSPLL